MLKNHLKRIVYSPEREAQKIARVLLNSYEKNADMHSYGFGDARAIYLALKDFGSGYEDLFYPHKPDELENVKWPPLKTIGPLEDLLYYIKWKWGSGEISRSDTFKMSWSDSQGVSIWKKALNMRLGLGINLWHAAVAISELKYGYQFGYKIARWAGNDWYYWGCLTDPDQMEGMSRLPEHYLYIFDWPGTNLNTSKDLQLIRKGVSSVIENPGLIFAREFSINNYPNFKNSNLSKGDMARTIYKELHKDYKTKTNGGSISLTYDFKDEIGHIICRVMGINEIHGQFTLIGDPETWPDPHI